MNEVPDGFPFLPYLALSVLSFYTEFLIGKFVLNVGKETVSPLKFRFIPAKINELLPFVDRVLDNNLLGAICLTETAGAHNHVKYSRI